jgi:hypothetical protein
MSNPSKSSAAPVERKEYVVSVPGPIVVNGVLVRKGDVVKLGPIGAKGYSPFIKRKRAAAKADAKE